MLRSLIISSTWMARLALVLLLILPIASCSSINREQARQIGQVVGAVAGVAIGIAVGSDAGGNVAIAVGGAVGAALGAFIGGEIAEHLSEADRALASQATQTALDADVGPGSHATSGNANERVSKPAASPPQPSVAWMGENDDTVYGSSTVINTEIQNSRTCKLVREVAYVGGQDLRQDVRYCRDRNSHSWIREA